MPGSTDTALEIANVALLLAGQSKISAFTDNVAEATVANDLYEDIVEECLSEMRWRFAMRQVALSREVTAPLSLWDAAYTIPAASLLISQVTVNDFDIQYDIYDGKVLCNATASDTVVCDYIYRALEATWPAYFRKLVQLRLAAAFCVPLTRDETMSRLLEQKANDQKIRAALYDSQQQTTRKLSTSRFITTRRS